MRYYDKIVAGLVRYCGPATILFGADDPFGLRGWRNCSESCRMPRPA
jgi:hypothetical protein